MFRAYQSPARRSQLGDKSSDPPNRQSLRRRRFTEDVDDTATRLRDELPTVPVLLRDEPDEAKIDDELRHRCEIILEQVAEINGILSRPNVLPGDYTQDCRDRLVSVTRSTEEILESVASGLQQPRSMSAWLLRLKRQGRPIVTSRGKTH